MSTFAMRVWTVTSTSINDRHARDLLRLYFAEMASRYFGRAATDEEIDVAMTLYAKHGYVEIPVYSNGPYKDHWFEKRLV